MYIQQQLFHSIVSSSNDGSGAKLSPPRGGRIRPAQNWFRVIFQHSIRPTPLPKRLYPLNSSESIGAKLMIFVTDATAYRDWPRFPPPPGGPLNNALFGCRQQEKRQFLVLENGNFMLPTRFWCSLYNFFFFFSRQLRVLRCFDSIRISVAGILVRLTRAVVFIFRAILDFIYCWNGRLDVLNVLFEIKKNHSVDWVNWVTIVKLWKWRACRNWLIL